MLRFLLLCTALTMMAATAVAAEPRPNILWITCEDMGPQLGCYGDANARTPNLDRLAADGLRYRTVWSNAPVCAPARTTIISGVYPPSTGAEHMRSAVALPETLSLYPTLMREAGYYCTNNSKEDYNIAKPGKIWDESSNKAHWKNRAEGQPFFAIFNDTVTHESGIRRRPHKAVLDPARVRVPAYHPDTPEVRTDWAQYYDNIATMDARAGRILAELQEAGLADDTIVFFYGDHGSGMPRSKRWPYNSGLHVAMIVHIPEKFQHLAPPEYKAGGWSDRLVSFVDLAPTLLSLVGNQPPDWMQGHAFMGKHDAGPQPYVYGFRGRMDERYDLVRSVRDARYVYIRNYMPHLIYGQYLSYMFETPTTQVWKDLFDEGSLNAVQARFWQTKPPEELYDLQNDPDEVKNLVDSADHREVLERLRSAQRAWALKIRDVGFLPEPEIHRRSQGSTPYEMGHDAQRYPLEQILATAEAASSLKPDALPELHRAMTDADSAVRYWGVLGLVMRGEAAVAPAAEALRKSLADESVCVRIAAAEALGRFGGEADRAAVLATLLAAIEKPEAPNASLMALNVIDRMGEKAADVKDRLRPLAQRGNTGGRGGSYDARIYERLLGKLPKQTPVRGQ